jgi:hypothetical protein
VHLLRPGRSADLASWERRDFSPGVTDGPRVGDRHDAYEREVGFEAPGPPEPHGPHRRLAEAILGYRIFPPELAEGVLRRAPVEVGDTVGIRYHFARGIDLFFAARVIARFDELRPPPSPGGPPAHAPRHATGFVYRTLAGHPELGEESFSVEKEPESGIVWVALRSWSRPGTRLARAFGPVVRRLQVKASARALDHLERIAGHDANGAG